MDGQSKRLNTDIKQYVGDHNNVPYFACCALPMGERHLRKFLLRGKQLSAGTNLRQLRIFFFDVQFAPP